MNKEVKKTKEGNSFFPNNLEKKEKSKSMDLITKKCELKKFLKAIYQGISPEEYLRIVKIKKDSTSKPMFFKDIDKLMHYVLNSNRYYNNIYFQLSTTDNTGGREENLKYRYCLAFDFDKKDYPDLTAKDVMFRFIKIGLLYHYIVDTGNGFHVYIAIEKTNDLKKVDQLQKVLAKLLGADLNAIKKTQIMRIPYSFNIKDEAKLKLVRILHAKDKDIRTKKDVIPRNINYLYKKYCTQKNLVNIEDDNIGTKFVLDNTKLQPCVRDILKNGSKIGNRNTDLQKIVISLRNSNKSLVEIVHVSKEWDKKNEKSLPDLEYQVRKMFEDLKTTRYDCEGCVYNKNCFKKIESDFYYDVKEDDKVIITVQNKIARQISKKRGFVMNEYELIVVSVLKNYGCLTRDEIMDKLTYKKRKKVKNVAMCERVLKASLKSLVENGFLEEFKGVKKLGVSNKYQIKKIKCKTEDEFNISYFVTLAVVWGIITPSEMKLYYHLRYKHNLAIKNGDAQGNIFKITQSDLAKDLSLTQARISIMIEELLESKILDIWETKISDKGFEYYIYRLNK